MIFHKLFLILNLVVAQPDPEYGDYAIGDYPNYDYNYRTGSAAAETNEVTAPVAYESEPVAYESEPDDVVETGVESTEMVTEAEDLGTTADNGDDDEAPFMAYDLSLAEVVPEEEPETEEPPTDLGRSAFMQRNTVSYVSSINNLGGRLKNTGEIELSWDYDSSHNSYEFYYQELIGNSEPLADYVSFENVVLTFDDDSAPTKVYATFTPFALRKIYRIKVLPIDNSQPSAVSPESTIEVQSSTNEVTHLPGTLYTGGSGFAGQVLLVNDFTDSDFVRTAAGDSVGHVTVVKITFPAACSGVSIDANVDAQYIFTDDAIADTHRIFVFPQTHFSNQLSGPVKAFRYYVSNLGACLTSGNEVDVVTDNSYVSVQTLNADSTTSPQNITMTGMWPIGSSYPPVDYNEQHMVWFDTLIQQATHMGPSVALSAPAITFSTSPCNVYINVADEDDVSPGWGYVNVYDSDYDMTDLFSNVGNPGTVANSNYGMDFKFRALQWMNHIGVSFRYDATEDDCSIVNTAATISFIQLNPAKSLQTATNPLS